MKCIIFQTAILALLLPASKGDYTLLGQLATFVLNLASIIGPSFHPLYPQTYDNDQNSTHDFIIVGSGPTGSVLANRLSEISEWNILLLEAGPEASAITDIPLIGGYFAFTDYSWGYKAEPQTGFCRGCNEGRMELPRGNALGGSSIINYMIYVRGNPIDYDRWAAQGNPGWSYADILPYFLKIEDARIEKQDAEFHRKGGYLTVSDIPFRTKSADVYVKAAQEAGIPYVDYNGREQLGVSYVQSTTRDGRRCSAEKAFLRPARKRRNLKIQTLSRVVRILVDPRNKTAYGVEYIRNGRNYFAFATKEVILSAGSLSSPQLLMLSGIGPREQLKKLDIPIIQNSAVGVTMYDHALFPALTFQINESIVINGVSFLRDLSNPATYTQFFKQNRGMLTSIGGVEVMTYIRTNVSTDPDLSYPDVEIFYSGASLSADFGIGYRKIFNVPPYMYNRIWKPLEGKFTYQVFPMLVHPKSKGYIELRSRNPFDPPKFYSNFLSDPENHDVKTFIAAIRKVQEISDSPSMRKYGSRIVDTPIPGCEGFLFNSDEYWECSLRTIIGSVHHQVATCKMGPEHDNEAVVDARLKVHGIKRLRVADISIIPIPLTAHTVGPAYAIGEKTADLIKDEWLNI